jgi:death on curing protein
LEIEDIQYVTFPEAVTIHIRLMRIWQEVRYGVDDRTLIESALARPLHAAVYENAALIRQAATLYLGLIKNHPWTGGNKRTATAIVDEFLYRHGIEVVAAQIDVFKLSLSIESDQYGIDEIELWLREHTSPLK